MVTIPRTDKKGFLTAVQQVLCDMKTLNKSQVGFTYTVVCQSMTSDAESETWNMTFHNLRGRPFRAYVNIQITWKNGGVAKVEMPVEIWQTQKEFMSFLARECDK